VVEGEVPAQEKIHGRRRHTTRFDSG
jgi:hypothetical protein